MTADGQAKGSRSDPGDWDRPRRPRLVAGRNHVGMAGEHQVGRGRADARVKILDVRRAGRGKPQALDRKARAPEHAFKEGQRAALVSPGLNLQTVEFAVREEKLMMAGALTPTEVITAWEAGADFVKVFPCGQVGGAKYIKALKGPLPQVPLVPTGGVNLNTAAEFIEAGAAALGIGGELVQADALRSNKPEVIVENARKFLAIVTKARAQMATSGIAAKSSH